MQVRFRVDHHEHKKGDIIDVPKGEAKRLLNAGSAEYVTQRSDIAIEAAVDEPTGAETAALTFHTKTKKRRPI